MGRDSLYGKLRKILEKPPVPAHMRQRGYEVVIPWHRRFWQSIRPPSPAPTTTASLNPSQRRLLWITAAIVLSLLAVGGGINYLASAPERARAAFEDGMRLIGPGNFAGAAAKFSESISHSETAGAHLERGNAYKNLSKPQDALADWSRAIELDPSLAAAFTARATYYLTSGEPAKALPDLDQSIRMSPSVDAYFQRGQAYAKLGQYEKAIQDYDRAILERRDSPYVYLARSIARRALGDEAGFAEDQKLAAELQRP